MRKRARVDLPRLACPRSRTVAPGVCMKGVGGWGVKEGIQQFWPPIFLRQLPMFLLFQHTFV